MYVDGNEIKHSLDISAWKTIQDLHDELMLIAEHLNAFSSWSLLFWLGNLSVHSVSNLYFIIDLVVLKPWTPLTGPFVFNMFAWLLAFIGQLLILHIGCDYTITEVRLTSFASLILIP